MDKIDIHEASFRDNSGFVFRLNGELYRQINYSHKDEYEQYISSGLHDVLVSKGYLIRHKEVELRKHVSESAYKILKPERIPYISYPYEWSFSQFKNAALLTLEVQKLALEYGFCLKDASAYNVQFYRGKPIFIDTLSFKRYQSGPWVGYRQFCQHFLAPLALKYWKDHRLGRMGELFIDGIPLDLASSLLPKKTWLNFNILTHIHLHAKLQSHYGLKGKTESAKVKSAHQNVSKKKMMSLIQSMQNFVRSLNWKHQKSEWSDYYSNTNYEEQAMRGKEELVRNALAGISCEIKTIADIGANTGHFSQIASEYCTSVFSFDMDESAVEQHYLRLLNTHQQGVLPLVLDLFNPPSSIGWSNTERSSFMSRANFDVVIALALIHHLAISNNVPLTRIVDFFHAITNTHLIIEFVSKEDSQVKHLLATREDVFTDYHEEGFEKSLHGLFNIVNKTPVPQSTRILYSLEKIHN